MAPVRRRSTVRLFRSTGSWIGILRGRQARRQRELPGVRRASADRPYHGWADGDEEGWQGSTFSSPCNDQLIEDGERDEQSQAHRDDIEVGDLERLTGSAGRAGTGR